MAFEKKHQQLLSPKDFFFRQVKYFLISLFILVSSLSIGVLGYNYFANLNFIDSFYNASMILTGMGPVDKMTTNAGKLFAAFYALFSGVAFLTTSAILLAPLIHRLMHLMHIDIEDTDEKKS